LRLAQAEKKEEHIRKMAILARAEKAALMEESLKDRKVKEGIEHSDSDSEADKQSVG